MASADVDQAVMEMSQDTVAREPLATREVEAESRAPDNRDLALEREVLDALKAVYDPEIPVNLVDLGLIYALTARPDGLVKIEMTLTTPACPVAGSLPGQVQNIASLVPRVSVVLVELVWSPPWTRDRMSEEAKLELGFL